MHFRRRQLEAVETEFCSPVHRRVTVEHAQANAGFSVGLVDHTHEVDVGGSEVDLFDPVGVCGTGAACQ